MRASGALLALLALAGCTAVHYESPRLAEHETVHEMVAVLPFVMVFTGRLPADLGPAQVAAIEEAESLAFQHSLYNRLLDRSSINRKRPILVRMQPVETTNRILGESGIGIRHSWAMPAEELAAVLGVDAVIRTRIVKERLLSDIGSYGREVGLGVLEEVLEDATEREVDWLIPPGLTRTHDVHAESSLVSGTDGDLLWRVEIHRATDWRRPANDVIVGITGKLSRKFPYRG